MLVYLIKGKLPWMSMTGLRAIFKAKSTCSDEDLCQGLPSEWRMLRHSGVSISPFSLIALLGTEEILAFVKAARKHCGKRLVDYAALRQALLPLLPAAKEFSWSLGNGTGGIRSEADVAKVDTPRKAKTPRKAPTSRSASAKRTGPKPRVAQEPKEENKENEAIAVPALKSKKVEKPMEPKGGGVPILGANRGLSNSRVKLDKVEDAKAGAAASRTTAKPLAKQGATFRGLFSPSRVIRGRKSGLLSARRRRSKGSISPNPPAPRLTAAAKLLGKSTSFKAPQAPQAKQQPSPQPQKEEAAVEAPPSKVSTPTAAAAASPLPVGARSTTTPSASPLSEKAASASTKALVEEDQQEKAQGTPPSAANFSRDTKLGSRTSPFSFENGSNDEDANEGSKSPTEEDVDLEAVNFEEEGDSPMEGAGDEIAGDKGDAPLQRKLWEEEAQPAAKEEEDVDMEAVPTATATDVSFPLEEASTATAELAQPWQNSTPKDKAESQAATPLTDGRTSVAASEDFSPSSASFSSSSMAAYSPSPRCGFDAMSEWVPPIEVARSASPAMPSPTPAATPRMSSPRPSTPHTMTPKLAAMTRETLAADFGHPSAAKPQAMPSPAPVLSPLGTPKSHVAGATHQSSPDAQLFQQEEAPASPVAAAAAATAPNSPPPPPPSTPVDAASPAVNAAKSPFTAATPASPVAHTSCAPTTPPSRTATAATACAAPSPPSHGSFSQHRSPVTASPSPLPTPAASHASPANSPPAAALPSVDLAPASATEPEAHTPAPAMTDESTAEASLPASAPDSPVASDAPIVSFTKPFSPPSAAALVADVATSPMRSLGSQNPLCSPLQKLPVLSHEAAEEGNEGEEEGEAAACVPPVDEPLDGAPASGPMEEVPVASPSSDGDAFTNHSPVKPASLAPFRFRSALKRASSNPFNSPMRLRIAAKPPVAVPRSPPKTVECNFAEEETRQSNAYFDTNVAPSSPLDYIEEDIATLETGEAMAAPVLALPQSDCGSASAEATPAKSPSCPAPLRNASPSPVQQQKSPRQEPSETPLKEQTANALPVGSTSKFPSPEESLGASIPPSPSSSPFAAMAPLHFLQDKEDTANAIEAVGRKRSSSQIAGITSTPETNELEADKRVDREVKTRGRRFRAKRQRVCGKSLFSPHVRHMISQ